MMRRVACFFAALALSCSVACDDSDGSDVAGAPDLEVEASSEALMPGDRITVLSDVALEDLDDLSVFFRPQGGDEVEADFDVVADSEGRVFDVFVPPFVAAGTAEVIFRFRGSRVRAANVEIAEIHSSFREEDLEFGIIFSDAETFSAGSDVSLWIRTPVLNAGRRQTAPARLNGTITSHNGGHISFDLAGAVDSRESNVLLSYRKFDVSSGRFAGVIHQVGREGVTLEGQADIRVEHGIRSVPVAELTGVEMNRGPDNSLMEIQGRRFGATQGRSRVVFDGQFSWTPEVVSWSDTKIVVKVSKYLVGPTEIVVVVGSNVSYPFFAELGFLCGDAPDFEVTIGGRNEEAFNSVTALRGCAYALGGTAKKKGYVVKTDKRGNVLWDAFLGESDHPETVIEDVVAMVDGGVMAVGWTVTENGDEDMLVARLNALGDVLWSETFGKESGNERGHAGALARMMTGMPMYFVVAGEDATQGRFVQGALWSIKLSNGGLNAVRITESDGDLSFTGVHAISTSIVMATGTSSSANNANGQDIVTYYTDNHLLSELIQYYNADGDQVSAASELYDDGFISVGQDSLTSLPYIVGAATSVDPDLGVDFQAALRGETLEVSGVHESEHPGFVVAGTAMLANLLDPSNPPVATPVLTQVDCKGQPVEVRRLSSTSRNPAQRTANDAAKSFDQGTVLAGKVETNDGTGGLFIKTGAFDVQGAKINTFTMNSSGYFLAMDPSVPVTLRWQTENTTEVIIEALSATSPEADALATNSFTGPQAQQGEVSFVMNVAPGFTGGAVAFRLTARGEDCESVYETVLAGIFIRRAEDLDEDVRDARLQEHGQNILQSNACNLGLFSGKTSTHPRGGLLPTNGDLCFLYQGKPFARLCDVNAGDSATESQPDPNDPFLFYYDRNDKLVGFGYARNFQESRPTSIPIAPEQWFGHWSGWHWFDDGTMTLWFANEVVPPVDEAWRLDVTCPVSGGECMPKGCELRPEGFDNPAYSAPDERMRGSDCGFKSCAFTVDEDDRASALNCCGAIHNILWDTHIFFETASNDFGFRVTPAMDGRALADMVEPCGGVDQNYKCEDLANDCEAGEDPSGVNVFFDVDLNAPSKDESIIPLACTPDPGGILSTHCGQ